MSHGFESGRDSFTPENADMILSSRAPVNEETFQPGLTPGFHSGNRELQPIIDLTLEQSLEECQQEEYSTLGSDRVPLHAYLACALTNLNESQRDLMVWMSNTTRSVCDSEGISLYEPRTKTDPSQQDEFTPEEVFHLDRTKVLSSDLLIALTNEPSFGAGQELDFAFNANIPIILLVRTGHLVSRMVRGIPGLVVVVEYDSPEVLHDELTRALVQLRPLLQERRIRREKYELNVVGDRIRRARESARLTTDEVAAMLNVTPGQVIRWEQSTDAENNFSLVQLRDIATSLNTSLAQLVESSIDSVCQSYLREVLDGKNVAARWGQHSSKDRKKLLSIIINRLAVELGIDEPN